MPGERLYRLTEDAQKGVATLEVRVDLLGMADRDEFMAGCRALLASGRKRLVLDLRGVRRMFSIFLGTIIDIGERAHANGQALTVRVPEQVARLLRSVLGDRTLDIDVGTAPEGRAGLKP